MKTHIQLQSCLLLALVFVAGSAHAQLAIPSDGSDGDLNISSDTTIDLSQASTGAWNSPGSGKGVYDANKWAVVFKYNSVNIAAGKTLSFKNNAQHAPVVWLVKGNVSIDGTLKLDGTGQEPGPGGFRGGYGAQGEPNRSGRGFGIGGGSYSQSQEWGNAYGSGEITGGSYASVYGNAQILPLIGGSGGSGSHTFANVGFFGGGGGGAILIASAGTIALNGGITSYGGDHNGSFSGAGSGGAIRLLCNALTGTGFLKAMGANDGRVRIEANSSSGVFPVPSTVRVDPDTPVKIWPDANAPTLRVVSVQNVTVPADPKSNLDAAGADVVTNATTPVNILLEATNFLTTGKVTIRITRKFGDAIIMDATLKDGNTALSHWEVANVSLPQGFSAVQAIAKP